MGASQHPAAAFLFMIAAFLLPTMTAQEKGGNLWTEQARLQHSLSQGLLNDPGTRVLAEFVPSSDQRPARAPRDHQPGDGFDAKASLTFSLLDETVSGKGTSSSDDWKSGGTEAVQAIAQDVVSLGPFAALHRFESLHSKNAAMTNADGLLGMSFSNLPDSASLLQTLFHHQRASWHVEQPPSFRELRPRLFAIAVGDQAGQLQLGGYDARAMDGGEASLQFVRMRPGSGYVVRVQSVLYGGETIAEGLGQEGAVGGSGQRGPTATVTGKPVLEAVFDTGSTCIMIPDNAVGAAKGSMFRKLLDAHMRHGEAPIQLQLVDEEGGHVTLTLPYHAWTHPSGCLGPYAGSRIVLGEPVFRRRVVVHDLGQEPFKLGIAPLDLSYPLPVNPTYPLPPTAQSSRDGSSELVLPAKVPLQLDGDKPSQRYLLTAGVGTPIQELTLVLDTGGFLTQVYTCDPCLDHHASSLSHDSSHDSSHAKSHAHASSHATSHAAARHGATPAPSAHSPVKLTTKEAAKARVGALARREQGRHELAPLAGADASFQMWGMLAMGMLVAAVLVSEIRRRNSAEQPRFRLVEYEAVEGQPSRFEFSDL